MFEGGRRWASKQRASFGPSAPATGSPELSPAAKGFGVSSQSSSTTSAQGCQRYACRRTPPSPGPSRRQPGCTRPVAHTSPRSERPNQDRWFPAMEGVLVLMPLVSHRVVHARKNLLLLLTADGSNLELTNAPNGLASLLVERGAEKKHCFVSGNPQSTWRRRSSHQTRQAPGLLARVPLKASRRAATCSHEPGACRRSWRRSLCRRGRAPKIKRRHGRAVLPQRPRCKPAAAVATPREPLVQDDLAERRCPAADSLLPTAPTAALSETTSTSMGSSGCCIGPSRGHRTRSCSANCKLRTAVTLDFPRSPASASFPRTWRLPSRPFVVRNTVKLERLRRELKLHPE